MTGNEHFTAAEALLSSVRSTESGSPQEAGILAEAQVHATLALAWAFNRAQTDANGLQRFMAETILERQVVIEHEDRPPAFLDEHDRAVVDTFGDDAEVPGG